MQLLLVRHAESMGNATGDYSTAIHDSLSDKGREQARNLTDKLAVYSIDHVIVSPLQRTMETIEPYLCRSDMKAEIWPELAECCWQSPEKEKATSWREEPCSPEPGLMKCFSFRDGKQIRPAEDETYAEGIFRTAAALDRIQSTFADSEQTVLAVTHGHFLREFLNLVLAPSQPVRFPHANCALSSVSLGEDRRVDFINRLTTSQETY